MRRWLIIAVAVIAANVSASSLAFASAPSDTARDLFAGAWLFYRSAFLSDDGRIIDNANGDVSHSEGQGYGMLLAVAADDRASFDHMWKWTRDNLMVRKDSLAAWRWDPASDPNVVDSNNASDGDLLIAWALLRAYRKWSEPGYFAASKDIAVALGRHAVVDFNGWTYLLPGADGFMTDSPDIGPIVNTSYWVFPALEELQVFAPQLPADRLIATGLKLVRDARFGEADLPADWTAVGADGFTPSEQFPTTFGYNAIRVPLYLAWFGGDARDLLSPFKALWSRIPEPSVIDITSGKPIDKMYDAGYGAIINVVGCAEDTPPSIEPAKTLEMKNYYPSTLSMLSLLAMVERYPQCLDAL